MANVGKADLVMELAEQTGLGQKDVETVAEGMREGVQSHLKQGDKVQLIGFRTPEVRERSARTGVKPGTTEKTAFPANKVPAFEAGKSFKDEIA